MEYRVQSYSESVQKRKTNYRISSIFSSINPPFTSMIPDM